MVTLLQRLERARARRSARTIIVWALVLSAAGVSAVLTGISSVGTLRSDGSPDARVVVELPEGETVTSPETAERVRLLVQRLRSLPQVAQVTDPLGQATPTVAADLGAVYADVTYAVPVEAVTAASRSALLRTVEDAAAGGGSAAVGGPVGDAVSKRSPLLPALALVAGCLLAGIAPLVGLRSLSAAVAVLVTALVGGLVGATASPLAGGLAAAVGLGGALLAASSLRGPAETGEGLDSAPARLAARRQVATAGAVAVLGFAGLALLGVPELLRVGLGTAGGVLAASLAALTLLPALSGVTRTCGDRRRRAGQAADRPAWKPRNALFAAVATTLVLMALCVPAASLPTALGGAGEAPRGSQARTAHDLIVRHWGPGVAAPLLLTVDGGSDAGAQAAALAALAQPLPGVAAGGVSSPALSQDGRSARLTIIPAAGPGSTQAAQLVADVRALPTSGDGAVTVTGAAALNVDLRDQVERVLPPYLAAVAILAVGLLGWSQRSLLSALGVTGGWVLSSGAALGVLALVVNVVDAPVHPVTPLLVPVALLGLATCHQLLGHGRAVLVAAASAAALLAGLSTHAGAITAAVGLGVLTDAVVVRLLLAPAVRSLMARPSATRPPLTRERVPVS